MRALGILLLAAVTVPGCDGTVDPGTAAAWTAKADAAFAEGDRYAQQPDGLAEAVAAWREAGRSYVKAFRLVTPEPEQREARALLAFRIGRACSKAARETADETRSGPHGDRALFWFAHARRLEPGLRQAYFERAVLFDSDIAEVADATRAREAYAAYVRACTEAGASLSDAERERVTLAKQRLEELTPPR